MPRDEITIEPHVCFGARVFVNRGGGVTVEQVSEDAGETLLIFDPDEAEVVAKAMLEVAQAAKQVAGEVDDEPS